MDEGLGWVPWIVISFPVFLVGTFMRNNNCFLPLFNILRLRDWDFLLPGAEPDEQVGHIRFLRWFRTTGTNLRIPFYLYSPRPPSVDPSPDPLLIYTCLPLLSLPLPTFSKSPSAAQ